MVVSFDSVRVEWRPQVLNTCNKSKTIVLDIL